MRLGYEEIEQVVRKSFEEVIRERDGGVKPQFALDDILLESGLDSLGFAILVFRLEEELGYDPFSEAEEAYYPQSFRDFIDFYHKNQV